MSDSTIDAVYQEAADDLRRLLPVADKFLAEHGREAGAVYMTSGLLRQSCWDRVMLASVLGAALMRISDLESRP